MYGIIFNAKILILAKAPPENIFNKLNTEPVSLLKKSEITTPLIPGKNINVPILYNINRNTVYKILLFNSCVITISRNF